MKKEKNAIQRPVDEIVKPFNIFSGDYSDDMWAEINGAKTIIDMRLAVYTVCCRLQEFEHRLNTGYYNAKKEDIMSQKYHIKFDFTSDRQDSLLATVWPETLAKRIIQTEFGIEPKVDNGNGDVRYETDDPALMLELMKLAKQHSAGGWWCVEPMPKDETVFHFGMRGGKYSNCPDYKAKD